MSNIENLIAGSGQHSHPVPTVPGLVVEIRDSQHDGTAVWRWSDAIGGGYGFASRDAGTVQSAPRCVLVVGVDVLELPEELAYGCDLDSPRGLALVGVELDDDLGWLADGAEVLWDSAGQPLCATDTARSEYDAGCERDGDPDAEVSW